ncbi:MAG TPA: FtsL-like putative cell division protein [Tenuifilaceae bacterium]|nr:FtsL-like putative cell division protein [Tenuifilaceae bacterium]HPE17608.1 FtsL-like putative cell division protein [Tenuifilaceae bacterium]HPJ44989.1 FtsL-like putative cell division protein [Tenuifilaceae bacterium]HPQ33764.1 FtsL-like putative cell division protein [Tenuifilaceae bacterium]HRX67655.1 FtsL-like putative cell division protein [Tenuifilaceae bacterium]
MSEENQNVEFIDAPKEQKGPKKNSGLKDILTGNILSRESVSGQVPYILFLALLAVIYIANRYKYEKLVKQDQILQVEVKNLRAESITMASQLMFISKQSEVSKLIEQKGLGLKESVVPPKKIKAKL